MPRYLSVEVNENQLCDLVDNLLLPHIKEPHGRKNVILKFRKFTLNGKIYTTQFFRYNIIIM